MKEVRKAGFAITSGQINPHLTAIAAPVTLSGGRQVSGSLCRIMLAKDFRKEDARQIADALMAGASEIGGLVEGRLPASGAAPLKARKT